MTVNLRAAIAADTALAPGTGNVATVDASSEAATLADLIADAERVSKSWVIELPMIGQLFEDIAKRVDASVFHTDAVPGSLFVTNETLAANSGSVLVANGVIGATILATVETSVDEQVVSKVLKTAEERFVLGVVLVPETKDSQGDLYSHEEVRKAAHGFMENSRSLGKQHGEIVTEKQMKILESYVAPADFEMDSNTVTAGTWLLGIRVVDDDLWAGIKKGEFTGFSIGGHAFRKPEAD